MLTKMIYQGYQPTLYSLTVNASSSAFIPNPNGSGNYVGTFYYSAPSGVSLMASTPSSTFSVGSIGLAYTDGQNYYFYNSGTASATVNYILI